LVYGEETLVDRGDGAGPLHLWVAGERTFATHRFPDHGTWTIGRSPDAEVHLDDQRASRFHARLHFGQQILIEDLDSSNGTWLNKRRLSPRKPEAIGLDDVVTIGNVMLLLRRGTGPIVRPESPSHAPTDSPIVVEADSMKDLYRLLDRVSKGTINVLILGETGVGKEIIARAVHSRSPRASRPFVALNCAALTETLLESELFGYERGAFTGAQGSKIGLLASADGGTVFLDEVGEMPPALQTKLLRVIEEHAVQPLGALKPRSIDVRFITATLRDLERDVAAGRFRQDLYFRLNGVSVIVPPLRERVVEIEPLTRCYIAYFSARLGLPVPEILPEALELLKSHQWPGNIRELRNRIECAVLVCGDGPIRPEHLPLTTLQPTVAKPTTKDTDPTTPVPLIDPDPLDSSSGPPPEPTNLKDGVETLERERIRAALDACAGNQTLAARKLGISRGSLRAKLDRYGVPRPRKGRGR
jgi:transcriptional regulator with PAS, ATPase and Fis domain